MPAPPVLVVAHGDPARQALWDVIAAAQAGDALAPVTVAVPSPYAGLSLRRELGSRSGLVNVRFMALARVAELLGAPVLAATGRRPLTPAVRTEAVHAALGVDPGPFAEVADHPSTASRLGATFRDLRRAEDQKAASGSELTRRGPRAAAVVACYEEFRRRTSTYYDEEDLLAAATDRVSGAAADTTAAEVGHVVVWLPTGLSPGEERFVHALLAAGRATVVLGLTGDAVVDDAQSRALAQRLGAGGNDTGGASPTGTQVLSAADPEDEVRAVVRRVVTRAEAGTPLHEIAILYRLDEPYGRLVPELLHAAGVEWNGPSPRRLADSVAARMLLRLLALADTDLARDEVAAWMASGPVLDPVDGHAIPAARWDVISREAGVVSGAVQWADRLTHHREELTRALAEARSTGEEAESRVRRIEGELETIDRLARFVADLATAIAPPSATTWAEHASWAESLLERYLGGEGRRGRWPETELEAGRRVVATLRGLAALDELGTTVDVSRFRRALAGELDVPFGRVQRFGTGVFVGPLHHAYGSRFDTIFVVGMFEGGFPPRGREDPLLPDRDRRGIAALPLHATRRHEERRDFLAALAAATNRVLCFPRADPRAQRTRLPSRWLLETARVFEGSNDLTADGLRHLKSRLWLDAVPSFQAGVQIDGAPASITEYDVRSLVEWRDVSRDLVDHPLATGSLGAGVHAIQQRATAQLTAYDGLVGPSPGLAIDAGRSVAPTSLQDWATCPFRYLLARVLRVREVPKPEVTETLSALDEGTLVHAILEDFVAQARPRTSPADPWEREDAALLLKIADAHCDDAEARGITGRPLQWKLARRGVIRTVGSFLATDAAIRADRGAVPSADGLELAFGDGTPVTIELDDGRGLSFRGRIDRVDRTPDGSRVVVYDYKTGSWRDDLSHDPVCAGTRLQLPVYALAGLAHSGASEAEAYYWYTKGDGVDALEGYTLDDEVRERFADVVGTIADGIGAGSFPANPGGRGWNNREKREAFENCSRCPYDRLCPSDRHAAWERKIDDDAVEPYRRLALDDEHDDEEVDGVSAARLPVDQAERDRVRDEHGASVFVEAGAGTGKTRAIVDRIVAMVAAGRIELRELAAITFTEAAASELRDRVRAALEAAADGHDARISEPGGRERCRQALDQIDDAALTTIHGFAQRILTEHPLEAGLPPGFEVLDPIRARVQFEQRWAAFVDDLFAADDLAPTLLRGLALGLTPTLLHGVALDLNENHDRLPAGVVAVGPLPPLAADEVLAALDEMLRLARECCHAADDKLALHIAEYEPMRDLIPRAAAVDELELIDCLSRAPQPKRKAGQKGNWSVPIDEVREATAAVDDVIKAVLGRQRRAVLGALGSRVIDFVRAAADDRRRAGTLQFHDLLVLARDVLRRDPDVQTAVASRYRCVLLDEFQDTDPLQIEIAVLITAVEGAIDATPWPDIRVRPGALVVVGDPKQSIYRFRRADLRVYHDAQTRLDLVRCGLVENFRSVPAVIDFVNHLFDVLLDDDPGIQAAHVELHAHTDAPTTPSPVITFGEVSQENVGDVRAVEADDVAALVGRIKDDGWLVRDVDTGDERPARYEDIALLIPSRTVLPALEDALERADVPVRVESQSLVFSTADVRDLLAALTAIDDPTDEIAVVAALRSPAFGCSDADLFEYVSAGGRWDYRRDPPEALPPDHPVVAGLVELRGFWEQRWWRSVSETLEAIVRERQVLELAVARRLRRDHWRRVRYLLDQARAWDDAGDASLRSFVEWVQEQADERARVSESVAPEPDHDALRILTVHGAKGLEFPIVVLAGLNTTPARPDRPVVWTAGGPEMRVGVKSRNTRVETDGYDSAAAEEDRHEAAERLRLLYVATTRARDHLALSLHHKARSDCHAKRIVDCLDGAPHLAIDLGTDRPARRARPKQGPVPASADTATRSAWREARTAALERAAAPSSVAATALATSLVPDPGLAKDEQTGDDLPPWRRGRAGTAIGRAVHAVLQTIDLATGEGLDATARAQALAEEVPSHEAEIRELAASVLSAPIVRAAVGDGGRFWREVPVAAGIDGMLVEGFIDLLVETDGSFVIVDYKTDRAPSEEDLDGALARYTPQGAAYALALEAVLGRPVSRCVFVFARPGGAVEREIPDLPAAVTTVRGLLASAGGV